MASVTLPAELAPGLRERVLSLLEQVTLAEAPRPVRRTRRRSENRCAVCRQGGVLGGHHGEDDKIEWIHRSCHRRLHRHLDARACAAAMAMAMAMVS